MGIDYRMMEVDAFDADTDAAVARFQNDVQLTSVTMHLAECASMLHNDAWDAHTQHEQGSQNSEFIRVNFIDSYAAYGGVIDSGNDSNSTFTECTFIRPSANEGAGTTADDRPLSMESSPFHITFSSTSSDPDEQRCQGRRPCRLSSTVESTRRARHSRSANCDRPFCFSYN